MRILLNFTTVLSIYNEPVSLQELSLQTLKNSFKNETAPDALERLYPSIFTTQQSFNKSGLFDVFVHNKISLKNIDLSNLKAAESILKVMTEVERLDLSNSNAAISASLFENKPKLKEVILNNCNLKEEDFEIVDKIVTLERLSISSNKRINIKTEAFARIVRRLTHLDISDCNLDYSSFQFIFEHADKLVSLNFSRNNLNRLNSIDRSKFKKKLEILKLSNCNIKARDLEYIFIFENLKEIDLSVNNLSDMKRRIINRLFRKEENTASKRKSLMNYVKNRLFKKKYTIYLNNLKTINLNNCTLDSERFIINLLNIKGLESINLSGIYRIDICRCLMNCKSKETIKRIEISNCLIFGSEIFYILNDFSSLEYLDISVNNINSVNEFSFGNICNSLIYLNISRCEFRNLSGIGEFKKLVYLHASFNKFLNIPVDFNESLKESLKEVIMRSSQLDTNSLAALFNCKNIEKLDISKNLIQNIPEYFSFNDLEHSLKYLNVEFCNLNLNGLKAIARCSKLKVLNASGNRFLDIGSDLKLNRSLLNSLNEVYLSDCEMNHYGLIAFTDCYNLEKLDVSFNSFEDLPSDYRINSRGLKELHINSCKLKSLKSVTDCLYLKYLNASSNTFLDLADNCSLGISRNSLEYLNLSRCELKFKHVLSITKCKRLKFVDLSLNDLSDDLSF